MDCYAGEGFGCPVCFHGAVVGGGWVRVEVFGCVGFLSVWV